MKELQYKVYDFADPKFPIHFEYVNLKEDAESTPHWHTNIEIIYFLLGEANVLVNGQTYHAKSGDIVIINTNDIHSIKATSEQIHYYSLVLDNTFCAEQNFDTLNTQFNVLTRDTEMKNIFQIIGHEMNKEKKYHKDAVRALSITMLILLFRNQRVEVRDHIDTQVPQLHYVKDGIQYIHHHFTDDINLDDIAEHVGVSKYHFSRVFKDVTSITINQYINSLRCNQARQLLLTTELPVSEVAEQTGFRSVSYFTKAYKRSFNQTPSEARRHKMQQNAY